ncbi:MAG: class I SAM-dependent methyltransferase [Gammaproteobacteria bacterium]|nr:class I SAM-dependent methyltransferase [Gammaproteobacteria bacterium]
MIKKIKKFSSRAIQHLRLKKIQDEYLSWLTLANAGMLSPGNVYSIHYAINNIPSDKPILEIGSFCGLSTNVISYLLSSSGNKNKIFTCDKWVFEGAENGGRLGESSVSHKDYREFVKSTYIKNIEFFSKENKPYTIEVFSDDFFNLWNKKEETVDILGRSVNLGGLFSFCYVDGNHTYEFAKRDFENIDLNLEVGGFILFDDSFDSNQFGLTKLMKEVKQKKNYKLVIKNPNYMFQKIA